MPNIFPTGNTPAREKRAPKAFDSRARAADGGLFINVPHPQVQTMLHLEWDFIVDTDLDTIESHFLTNRSQSFTYFEFTPRAINNLTIAGVTGSGAAGQVITLPAKNVSGLVVQVNGVTVSNYTFSAASGPDGEAQITTTGGGFASGGTISMSASNATTQRRHYVYYASVDFTEEPFESNLYKLTIDLEEKLP